MNKRQRGWILGWCLLAVQGQALASFAPALPNFQWSIEPSTGMYFDETQSGTGLDVDLIPLNGETFFFGAFYHYDPSGAPTWLTFQTFLSQTPLAGYRQSGVVASVSGPWIASNGGQCFDCAHHDPSTVATPFQRTINVVGARHLQMPASGNAQALELKRTDAVITSGHLLGKATLEGSTVYAVTSRWINTFQGPEPIIRHYGWVKFRLRPANEVHNLFSGFTAEPGATPNVIAPPAWMVVAGDPNTAPQYEAKCVHEVNVQGSLVGNCNDFFGLAESTLDSNNNGWTWLRDPLSDRIRAYHRCTGLQTVCNQFRATHADMIADVIEATPSRPGAPPRLIARVLNLEGGVFNMEVELSPVSPEELAAAFPHGVP